MSLMKIDWGQQIWESVIEFDVVKIHVNNIGQVFGQQTLFFSLKLSREDNLAHLPE